MIDLPNLNTLTLGKEAFKGSSDGCTLTIESMTMYYLYLKIDAQELRSITSKGKSFYHYNNVQLKNRQQLCGIIFRYPKCENGRSSRFIF